MPSDRRKRDDEYETHSAGRVSPGAYFGASTLFPDTGPEPQLITLSRTDTVLTIGSTVQLAAVVRDQFNAIMPGRTPTWQSDDTFVASVDSNGLVTAVGAGQAVIRAVDAGVASTPFNIIVAGTATLAIAISSGDGQSGTVVTSLASPLEVLVTSGGSPVVGSLVSWAIHDGTIPATSLTNASGIASANYLLGTEAGEHDVVATCATGASVTFTVTAVAGAVAVLRAVTSTESSGEAGAALAANLLPRVLAEDVHGNAVAGETVTFAVASGGGSGTTLTPSTDANGLATVGSWTLGASPGVNTMTATVAGASGSPVTFTATGTAVGSGAIASIGTFSGTGQTGIVAGAAAATLAWKVFNAVAAPVEGAIVTFAVTAGNGSLSVASAVTDATGKAEVTLTTGATVGLNTVTASVVDGDGNTLSLSISTTTVAGAATKLGMLVQPASNTGSGDIMPGQPIVAVQDANNNTVLSSTATVTVTVTSGDALLTAGEVSVAAVAGVVTYSGLVIADPTGGISTLTFASAGLTSAVSANITVAPPIPHHLEFFVQPNNVITDTGLILCTVRVLDEDGVVVPGATNSISIALTTPGNATLSGALSVLASNGVASFSNLIDTAGNYTLTASSVGLVSSTSASFTASATGALTPNLPSGMTLHIDSDLSGLALNTPISSIVSTGQSPGNMGLVYDGTGGANMRIQTISDQAWRNAFHTALPVCPNGYDRVHICQFGTASGVAYSLAAGEKGRYLMNLPANTRSVYIAAYVLIGSNFYGQSGSGDWKKWYMRTQSEGPTILSFKGATTATIRTSAYVGAHTTNITGSPDTTRVEAVDFNNMATMTRNTWYLVEGLFVTESASNAGDAHMTYWVDGVKKFQITACRLTTGGGGNLTWSSSSEVLHYYGGGGTTNVPASVGPMLVATGDHMQIHTSTSRVAVP